MASGQVQKFNLIEMTRCLAVTEEQALALSLLGLRSHGNFNLEECFTKHFSR